MAAEDAAADLVNFLEKNFSSCLKITWKKKLLLVLITAILKNLNTTDYLSNPHVPRSLFNSDARVAASQGILILANSSAGRPTDKSVQPTTGIQLNLLQLVLFGSLC